MEQFLTCFLCPQTLEGIAFALRSLVMKRKKGLSTENGKRQQHDEDPSNFRDTRYNSHSCFFSFTWALKFALVRKTRGKLRHRNPTVWAVQCRSLSPFVAPGHTRRLTDDVKWSISTREAFCCLSIASIHAYRSCTRCSSDAILMKI